jgi:hypothetical protein
LISIYVLWISVCLGDVFAQDVGIHFAVQPNSIQVNSNHTALTFMCRVAITNRTPTSLILSDLFQDKSGLCMKVSDTNDKELARLVSPPFHFIGHTIPAGSNSVFWPYYGLLDRFDPGTNRTVRLQLVGRLLGSSYTNPVASDIVDLKIP